MASSINKEKATVTMTLKDYETMAHELKWYKKQYQKVAREIKESAVIENGDVVGFDHRKMLLTIQDVIYEE